jgi:hypothetical protein
MLRITTLAISLLVAACGSDSAGPTDAGPPPTYTELFTRYFAPGTRGHCANSGCHGGANYNVWLCGTDKNTCYTGMTTMTALLINTANPRASPIADPTGSMLSWINPNGAMPADSPGPFPEGRDAILAWVAAGAQNN